MVETAIFEVIMMIVQGFRWRLILFTPWKNYSEGTATLGGSNPKITPKPRPVHLLGGICLCETSNLPGSAKHTMHRNEIRLNEPNK